MSLPFGGGGGEVTAKICMHVLLQYYEALPLSGDSNPEKYILSRTDTQTYTLSGDSISQKQPN